MKRVLLLLPLLLFLFSCDETTTNEQRFTLERYSAQGDESCSIRVLTDKYTGCKYLMACNDITSMPHTCKQDMPEGYVP